MISTQLRMIATVPLLLIGLLLLLLGSNESQQADQVYRLDEQQQQQLVNQLLSDNQQHLNVPGHYEFEMAPKMEPPSVRKPPYQQSAQICPGSNPFDGFSPRDTLCGDLNQGRLPLNPLGQSVLDQTYPFELIKNKTLQFLARALPVLKLEYETIPKVARYLPTNQLLNPTHMASPLTNEQMQRLNQHFSTGSGPGFAAAAASGQGQSIDELLSVAGQYSSKRRRRRRRSATSYSSQMSEGITVAELVPNTSLVVSSAHSAGRIGQTPGNGAFRNESKGEPLTTLAVITTKDGYKSIQTHLSSSSNSKSNSRSTPNQDNNRQQQQQQQQQQQVVVATQRAQNSANWTPNNNNNNNVYLAPSAKQATGGGHHFASYPAANSGDKSHQKQQSSASGQKTRNSDQQQSSGGRGAANATIENRMDESAVVGRSSDPQAGSHSGASQVNNNQQVPAVTAASGKQEPARRRQPCADSNGMIMSTLCHVVTAIAEGETKQVETKQPPWFQMLKRFNNVFSGASDSVVSASHPIWTIISSLTGQDVVVPASNAKSGSTSSSSGSNSVQSMSNLVSMLGHLSNLLSPASAKDASSVSSSSLSDGSRQQNKEQQLSLAGLGGSTLRNILVAGWASNLITKLAEYFVPTMMPSASGFSRRKNSYDLRQDRFVETPASLAAVSSAMSARQVEQATGANGNKQPPTPCPSVEEFISPTFARNYQGVWRYVVQIPHENYFTQIIQRTSCLRQKCEFTEGACHESPRWVNLLVAEIYYPNTVFGQPGTMVADQATAASTGNVVQAPQVQQQHQHQHQHQQQQQQQLHQQQQQPQIQPKSSRGDPLQMTDSLQSYNQNLNNAFTNMAHELNLDPNNVANMQYLANNYNYHLLHRNGLLPSQQAATVAAAEARSSAASSLPAMYSSVMAGQPAPYNNQQQQQQQQQSYASDYLTALAQMAIQQNPNMNIQELINSLQAQRRRKRDVGGSSLHNEQQQQQQQVRQQQHSQQVAQARSNLIESMPSLNDINQMMSPQQQQSQQMQPLKPPVGSNQHQQQVVGSPHTTSNYIDQTMSGSQANGQSQLGNEPANQAGGSSDPNSSNSNSQVECDGHDKIGCYVVRVYYDWFLVNGSCKCWKTANSQTTGASGSSNSNSFLRRIFNG